MKYSTGDVILTSKPLFYALNRCAKKKFCNRCLKKRDGLTYCSGCQFMFYCSARCQRADWKKFHKHECKILRTKRLQEESRGALQESPATFFSLIRMCIKYQYSKATFEKSWLMYDGTQRVIGDLISRSDICTEAQEYFWSELTNALNSFGIVVDKDTLIYRYGLVVGNTLPIWDESRLMEPEYYIGYGLYVEASTFDHSCRPNALCVFDGPMLTIRALTEIDTDKEKITISYIDRAAAATRDLRRAEIQKVGHFDCLCDTCTDENYSDAPRAELTQLIPRMITAMNKQKTKEVEQVSGKVFSLIQSIFGHYSKSYIEYMMHLVDFKCKQMRKNGMRIDVASKTTWKEFELCLRKTHGTEHRFYKACLEYGEILMPSNTPRIRV